MKKKLTIGILAHVDAGKTTLSEALLYLSGKIRRLGRVDHGNTYLDTNAVERERGITIFSKQARFSTDNCDLILLDTPGHVDFSAEAERTLALLDYAILVISGPDGVQSHTRTLWQLLEYYKVPTFIFVNKTDISIKLKEDTEAELARALSPSCVAFLEAQTKSELDEKLALTNERLLETYLSGEPVSDMDIASLIAKRRLFPCLFGSALRTDGIEFLLRVLDKYTLEPEYDEELFGAKVYKIARAGADRLTYMKLTGGCLTVRDELSYSALDGSLVSEKVNRIRLYSGDKFEQTDTVCAGEICAVCGLSSTYVGQGLGFESDTRKPVLEPVLSYRIILPEHADPVMCFPKLKELEEEEPSLHLVWNGDLREIEARLMGDIQTDLLKRMIFERFSLSCEFDAGKILYKEKAAARSIGVGHFEPLRHYAEVQLLLEPQPKGTGLIFDARLPENELDINWQRLILTHLYEKDHRGTLIGASLTDTKITLIAGRAHLKHTEGGDFREATYRAVRHGLMKAGCVLLEPYYKFSLDIPRDCVGRALSDLSSMSAEFEMDSSYGDRAVIVGRAPVSRLHGYVGEVLSYSRGEGRISCVFDGYDPCHNEADVVSAFGYDPAADLENTPHSVFCERGAGYVVTWDKVDEHKHLDPDVSAESQIGSIIPKASSLSRKYNLSDSELEEIMLREFGPIKRRRYSEPSRVCSPSVKKPPKRTALRSDRNMLIVDGYNVIYSWEHLKELADFSLEKARAALIDILSNYSAFTKTELIVVFDAYLVKDGAGSDSFIDGCRVIYTKKDKTADAYIEQMMSELGPDHSIRVVTGDRLLQFSAVHSGILRMTSKELLAEIENVGREINRFIRKLSEAKDKPRSKA